MEGIDRTALAPADAARVHESDEPETTPLTSTVDDAERAAACGARNVHVVQPFVDVVRDHDLQLLRIRMRRREFPEAAVAQMYDGVGISFH